MLRIDEICVKREEKSKINLSVAQSVVEMVVRQNASKNTIKCTIEDEQLKVIFAESISLQTAYRILKAFDKKRMRILKANAERKYLGPLPRGYFEVILR